MPSSSAVSPALANPHVATLWRDLLDFLEAGALPHVPTVEDLTAQVSYFGNPLLFTVELGRIYLFLPLFSDADGTHEERRAAAAYLTANLPLPAEFEGLADYGDEPYGQTGLGVELPMPRRFSPRLMSDALDLAAEVIEGLTGLQGAAG